MASPPNGTTPTNCIDAVERRRRGGMVALQWRRKTATPASRPAPGPRACRTAAKNWACCLSSTTTGAWLPPIDADGVHLGREDGQLSEARQALGPDKIIGCSCYNDLTLAGQALRPTSTTSPSAPCTRPKSSPTPSAPRWNTSTRPHAGRTANARPSPRAAVVAIGGITAENAAPVIQAGADSIALISALFESPDIHATARQCQALFV